MCRCCARQASRTRSPTPIRLRALPLVYVPTATLLDAAWRLRDSFSAGDALYAALAISAGETLLTTDRRLARAAAVQAITVQAPDD